MYRLQQQKIRSETRFSCSIHSFIVEFFKQSVKETFRSNPLFEEVMYVGSQKLLTIGFAIIFSFANRIESHTVPSRVEAPKLYVCKVDQLTRLYDGPGLHYGTTSSNNLSRKDLQVPLHSRICENSSNSGQKRL